MRNFTLQELNNLYGNKKISKEEYNILKSLADDYNPEKEIVISHKQPVIKSNDKNLISKIVKDNDDTAYQLYKDLAHNEKETAIAIAKENLAHVEKLFNQRMNSTVFKSNISQMEKEIEVWSSIDDETGMSLNREYQQSMRIIEGA